jgi:hypothetical protein
MAGMTARVKTRVHADKRRREESIFIRGISFGLRGMDRAT